MGALLYFLFGLNRIRTRARELVETGDRRLAAISPTHHVRTVAERSRTVQEIVQVSGAVTANRLLSGNRVEPLLEGRETYPRMLEAIASARESIYLSTYIFGSGEVGRDSSTLWQRRPTAGSVCGCWSTAWASGTRARASAAC